MSRVRNQQDFIDKSKEIHGNKYGYSLVEYVKSSIKVKIVCPEHGVFEQTPNKHLSGRGCPVCGRNRTKVGTKEFIRRAKEIHGDKYDYSKVCYDVADKKVEIICLIHGSFFQAPHDYVTLGHNCPKCGHFDAGKKRVGNKNVAHRQDVKDAKVATCLERYGATTWAGSEQGRQRLHDIIVHEGKLDKMKQTCQVRYGADFWVQSEEGQKSLHGLMSSVAMREKVAYGYNAAYGMHYMKTEEGRAKARGYIDEERRKKMIASMVRKYGVEYATMSPEIRLKIKATLLSRYGVENVMSLPEFQKKSMGDKT